MKMKKLMSGILAATILITSASVSTFADEVETTEATEETTEETESTEAATEEVSVETEVATEEIESTEAATEETESVEESTEAATEESSVEETEEVEIIETEEAESTEEVIEETEEAIEETESTEDFTTVDFSTEEVSLIDEVEEATTLSTIEVTDDTKLADNSHPYTAVGSESLVIGKTYTITLNAYEWYYLYDIPGSTDKDTYIAVLERVKGNEQTSATILSGKYTDTDYRSDVEMVAAADGITVDDADVSGNCKLYKSNKKCTAIIGGHISGKVTVNFTVVRLPSEAVDESKLNIIPDAKGNLTYVWEPTSDCDGMAVIVKTDGNDKVLERHFDKSVSKYKMAVKEAVWMQVTPYVLAGDIPVYANDCHVSNLTSVKPVTLKTPDTPKVTVDGHYVQITNDDENYKKYGFNGSDLCYEVRDANDKVLYKGDSFEELNSANYGYNRGYNLGKYAGQELKIRVWSTYRTHDAQQNVINLKSGKSDYKVFKVGGPDAPSSSVTTNDSKGIKLGFKTKGADGYVVYRSTSKKDGYEKVKTTESTSWTDATAAYGKTYYYKVKAYETINGKKVYGKFSDAVSAKSKNKSLAAPSGVSASSKSYKSIKLSWKSVSGAEGYAIYRSTSKDGSYKKVKITESTSWTDSDVATGKTYYYKVKAYKTANGEKKYGKYSSIVSTKAVLAKPSVTVKSKKAKQATISWKSVKDADGYVVYQSTSKNGSYKAVKTIKSSKTLSYTKTDLKGGKTYYYKVKAYKTVNDKKVYSSFSSIESIKVKK